MLRILLINGLLKTLACDEIKLNRSLIADKIIAFLTGDDEKLSGLHPSSAIGSLSSITTTSLVSEQGASDGTGSDRGDDRSEKQLVGIKHEKWWQTTIQVAIPFFIAGIGTIGAGIILGRVEVGSMNF